VKIEGLDSGFCGKCFDEEMNAFIEKKGNYFKVGNK
jgi:hypothetical protein